MEIEYLKLLEKTPKNKPDGFTNKGVSISEIENLEKKYNKGNRFPKSYREFLFLAGKFCWFFHNGGELDELIDYFQRDLLYSKIEMNRPIVIYDTNSSDSYYFMYLDEGVEDPIVYYITVLPPEELNCEMIWSDEKKFSEIVYSCIKSGW
ncbi:SMI1/KNR4 family protein [uncultured Dokdonia sp.]|uniref:SMI1/KNR4 family protein n=1 Tax=uncultured Dokdonia sp. TaxID=575653 RepID=UPI00261E9518|nr:SMI1/KNR4 family protein [uncultured Dokdonia sp.]